MADLGVAALLFGVNDQTATEESKVADTTESFSGGAAVANTTNSDITTDIFIQFEESETSTTPTVVKQVNVTIPANGTIGPSDGLQFSNVSASNIGAFGQGFLHLYRGSNTAADSPIPRIGTGTNDVERMEVRSAPIFSLSVDSVLASPPPFRNEQTIVATEDGVRGIASVQTSHTRDLPRTESLAVDATNTDTGTTTAASTDVTLFGGESALAEATTADIQNPGPLDVTLATAEDSATVSETAVEPPSLAPTAVTLQPSLVLDPVVIEGGRIDIETTVENTGDVFGAATLSVTLSGTEIVNRDVTVDANSSKTVTDLLDTKGVVGPGTHTVEASVGGSSTSTTLEVEPLPGDRIRIAPGNDSGPRLAPGSTTVRGP